MSVYSMLTDVGLAEINSAQPDTGILLEIAYWVASYDKQLDDDQQAKDDKANHIKNYTAPWEVYPNEAYPHSGDITYWNNTPTTLNNPQKTDLFPGVVYSPAKHSVKEVYRGEWDPNIEYYPANPTKGSWWIVNIADPNIDSVIYNNTPGQESDTGILYSNGDVLLYTGNSFINHGRGNEEYARGNFRVTLSAKEPMSVNKLSLYAVKRSVDGVIQNNPFMVGQVIFPKQTLKPKQQGSTAIDQIVIDFQIATKAVVNEFDNIMYASENDYWNRVTNANGQYGLQYDGSVFITNRLGIEDQTLDFVDNDDVGVGKTLIATFQSVNKPNPSEEAELPQLVLQYVRDDMYIGGNALSPRVRTTFRTDPDGDCEIDFYGSCTNKYDYYSLIPKYDGLFGLGNNEHRWKLLKTSDRVELYLGEKYETVEKTVHNASGNIIYAGTYVYITEITQSGVINVAPADSAHNSIGYAKSDIGIDSNGTVISTRDNRFDYIEENTGYILLKNNDLSTNSSLGMGYFGSSSIFVAPHYDDRKLTNRKDNYFYTYSNISNPISIAISLDGTTSSEGYALTIRSTKDLAIYNISQDYRHPNELGYGHGDDSQTNIDEIYNMLYAGHHRDWDKQESDFVKNVVKGMNGDKSIFKKFYSYNKWDDINYDSWSTIDDMRMSIYGQVDVANVYKSGEGIDHDMLLTSSRYIFIHGDIIPIVDGFNNLGSISSRFRDLYIDTIHGAKHGYKDGYIGDIKYNNWNLLTIDADIVPENGSKKITYNLNGDRFQIITCGQLGYNDYPIDNGYINNIYSQHIYTTLLDVKTSITIGNNMKITSTEIQGSNLIFGTSEVPIEHIYVKNLHYDKPPVDTFLTGDISLPGTPPTGINDVTASGKIEFTKDPIIDNEIFAKIMFDNGSASDGEYCKRSGCTVANDDTTIGLEDMQNGHGMINIDIKDLLSKYVGTDVTLKLDSKVNGGWDECVCDLHNKGKNDKLRDRNGSWNTDIELSKDGNTLYINATGGKDKFGDSDLDGERLGQNRALALLTSDPYAIIKITGNIDDKIPWSE